MATLNTLTLPPDSYGKSMLIKAAPGGYVPIQETLQLPGGRTWNQTTNLWSGHSHCCLVNNSTEYILRILGAYWWQANIVEGALAQANMKLVKVNAITEDADNPNIFPFDSSFPIPANISSTCNTYIWTLQGLIAETTLIYGGSTTTDPGEGIKAYNQNMLPVYPYCSPIILREGEGIALWPQTGVSSGMYHYTAIDFAWELIP